MLSGAKCRLVERLHKSVHFEPRVITRRTSSLRPHILLCITEPEYFSPIGTMADADEDLIHRGQSASEDTDLTEETQDFRFLASLS